MSDEEKVIQALAELWDIVKCRCHEAYTGRGLHDPDCQCDSTDALQIVTDRIEALSAKLATCEKYRDAYAEMDRIGTQAVRDLEAKLASGVIAEYDDDSTVFLSGYAGGAAIGGAWSTLTLMEKASDGTLRVREYKAQGDWRATIAEIKLQSSEFATQKGENHE